jgi:GNAT superfamily N-acetyltransferase
LLPKQVGGFVTVKTCYVDFEHRAIADLVSPGELTPNWTITRINVPKKERGKGYGSALLKQILADADAEGVTLQLEPTPSDGLDYDELVLWYVRYGFRFTPSGYMKRPPN